MINKANWPTLHLFWHLLCLEKSMIMLGMIIGSFAGGYMPTLMGTDSFSLTPLHEVSLVE